jgi:ABC-type thiamine transport system substrate-binding protein
MKTEQNLTVRLSAMMLVVADLQQAAAQPTIISTVPSNGATGVSPGAAVVFTFSTAMNPTATYVIFSDATANFESPTLSRHRPQHPR